jgi:phytol kinase
MTFKKELARKSLHFSGIFFLFLGKNHKVFSIFALSILILLYLLSLLLAHQTGHGIPGIHTLTLWLKRNGKMDLGPPLLALGIIFALAFFHYETAASAILQVCVADAAACLIGKFFGKRKIFYSKDKSYLGSFIFFVVAFLTQITFLPLKTAFALSFVGMILESLPFGALDNFLIPAGVALLSHLFF